MATARATAAWAARRVRRCAAWARARRSASAVADSESARPSMARSRSSAVRTSSLASISAFLAVAQRSATSSGRCRRPARRGGRPRFGLGQFGLEPLQLGQVLLGRQPGRGDGGLDPARLVLGRPGRARQPAQLAGDLRRRGVGLMPAGQGLGHRLPGGLLGGRRRRQIPRRRRAGPLGPGQPGGRLVRRRPLLEQALLPRRRPGPSAPSRSPARVTACRAGLSRTIRRACSRSSATTASRSSSAAAAASPSGARATSAARTRPEAGGADGAGTSDEAVEVGAASAVGVRAVRVAVPGWR